jgi:glycosyltransferase involved in cell wall biosynthesis
MVSISYAITACNEHVELGRLLKQLTEHIRPEDEIIVQLDTTATIEVIEVLSKFIPKVTYSFHSLNNDFATFKNNLKDYCTKDFIFFIDADEYLTDTLVLNLSEVLELNPKMDMYFVPRINTVEGLTEEHIQKWRWNVDEKGWINYPDYQTRICRNTKDIFWNGKVHERLTTAKPCIIQALPEGFELIHPKDIIRQERQNNFYNTL